MGLRSLADKENIDLLLVFSVERFGTVRNYYGFIPLGPPKALFQVKGQLVDLASNDLKWLSGMSQEEGVVAVVGDWDQPPNYPNLTDAFNTSVAQAKWFLQNRFFTEAKRDQKHSALHP